MRRCAPPGLFPALLLSSAGLCACSSTVPGGGAGVPALPTLAPAWAPVVDMQEAPPPPLPPVDPFVRGVVTAGGQPLPEVRIRVQGVSDLGGSNYIITGPDGSFDLPLPGRKPGDALVVTAAREGYRTVAISLPAPGQSAAVELTPLGADHPDYPFIAAGAAASGCASCHPSQAAAWAASQHAASATDPLFLDENRIHMGWWQRLDPGAPEAAVYAGPFRPADDKGDIGKLFHEGNSTYRVIGDSTHADDCARCHLPTYAFSHGVDVRPATLAALAPVHSEGVTCDLCHKTAGVRTQTENDLVGPGIDKLVLLRPAPAAPMTLGPLDDVTSPDMPSSYSPLFEKSEFCASCHSDARTVHIQRVDDQGNSVGPAESRNVWGEDTFREWRFRPGSATPVEPIAGGASTYSAAGDGPFTTPANYAGRPLQCQECHMMDPPQDPSTGERIADWQDPGAGDGLIANRKDAVKRDPRALRSHRMEGRTARYIAFAVELSAQASRKNGTVVLEVQVENRHTGHAFPSGLPDRNVLLEIEISDDSGPLKQISGPTLPGWASGDGKTDPARDLAGRPGKGFARLVAAVDEEAPVFYLRGVKGAGGLDTRLMNGYVDRTSYVFAARGGPVKARLKVVHRLRFKAQTDRYLVNHPRADPGQFETVGDVLEVALP